MSLAWGGYRNGRIPLTALALIPDTSGQYIKSSLLAPLQALRAAFKSHFGKQLDITEAYRDLRRQENLDYAWVHKYPGANLAAIPGTSIHGWAMAVDFGSGVNVFGSPEKVWMDANAPKYGLLPTGNGFSPREAWHFEGIGTVTASLGAVTINSTEEDGMGFYIGLPDPQQGKYWFSQVSGTKRLIGQEEWKFLRAQAKVTNGVRIVYVHVSQYFLDSIPNA